MQTAELLYQTLFNKPLSDETAENLLSDIVKGHPYFSPAGILLAKKTIMPEHIAAAAVHTPNAYWLHFLLAEEKTPQHEISSEKEPADIQQEPVLVNTELHPSSPGTTNEPLLFEPLHTSDYFASQGIKISAEIKPDDKLGKQLKSFTEWLKTMKKIGNPQEALTENREENFHPVLSMAEKSNTSAEVLTESMAEILVSQDKTQQAIDIYRKLSLLNPSKSAYFAAKIENLNTQ